MGFIYRGAIPLGLGLMVSCRGTCLMMAGAVNLRIAGRIELACGGGSSSDRSMTCFSS